MEEGELDKMRAVESHHWWHAVLHGQVMRVLQMLPLQARVLDAGCGTGGMLTKLHCQRPDIDAHGTDIEEQAVRHCHGRGLSQTSVGGVEQLPFDDEVFDAVLSLDVLYHAEVNENQALAEMRRVLRPGGLLVMNLPAFECLRGSHDAAVCGVRRYRSCHVQRLLQLHSIGIVMSHHWNAWMFLPLLVWRRWSLLRMKKAGAITSDLRLPPSWLNGLLSGVGRMDAWLCRMLHIPFGSSLFVVSQKPSHPHAEA